MRTERVDQSAAEASPAPREVGRSCPESPQSQNGHSRPRWVGSPAQLPVYLSLAYLPSVSRAFRVDEELFPPARALLGQRRQDQSKEAGMRGRPGRAAPGRASRSGIGTYKI